MNRVFFVLAQIVVLAAFIIMKEKGITGAGAMVFFAPMAIVILRRWYLQLKPFWFAKLKDIPKYFTEP